MGIEFEAILTLLVGVQILRCFTELLAYRCTSPELLRKGEKNSGGVVGVVVTPVGGGCSLYPCGRRQHSPLVGSACCYPML